MTKYRLDSDPDTGKPCMVADPDGIYYSAGEVDREIAKYQQQRFYFDKDGALRPTRNLFFGVGTIEFQPFPEPLTCKTHMEGEWVDEAGTHDGGTIPEGDRYSTGPASARESEGHSE